MASPLARRVAIGLALVVSVPAVSASDEPKPAVKAEPKTAEVKKAAAKEDPNRAFEDLLAAAMKDPKQGDFKAMREVFVETTAYSPYNTSWRDALGEVRKKTEAGDAKAAEELLKKTLEADRYMRIDSHLAALRFYDKQGRKDRMDWHGRFLKGIADQLFIPGKGLSYERPIDVVFIEEEYFFLSVLDLQPEKQELHSHEGKKFDVQIVPQTKDEKERRFYFCIESAQKVLHRDLGKFLDPAKK
jgi:hypothetical protein